MNRISTALFQHLSETPGACYVFDVEKLKSRIAFLRDRLPQDTALCYALKANPFLAKEAAPLVEKLELCSPGEVAICKALSIPSSKMVISGVCKTVEAMENWISDPLFDGVITIESAMQYRYVCRLSARHQKLVRILLRLTNGSQFGMDAACVDTIIRTRTQHPYLRVIGIQFFSGTQKTSFKKYSREIAMLDTFLTHLHTDLHYTPETLEYGPGLPVAYFEGEQTQEQALLQHLSGLLDGMQNKPKLVLELGRSIAASCGTYYTHIVDLKQNDGQNYALVDGGMHHLVYFGQTMAMQQPRFSVLGKEDADVEQPWTVCGSLCSMNDILLKQTPLPKLECGDILCFENAGAYCMTEGHALFLSRDLPAVYLKKEDGDLLCIRPPIETQLFNYPRYERM